MSPDVSVGGPSIPSMRTAVWVDCETTGLDARRHEVVELSWAVGDGDITTIVPPHTLDHADQDALRINRYFERGLDHRQLTPTEWAAARAQLTRDLSGAALHAANPAFDADFLRTLIGHRPWHHRLRDIEERAAVIFGWEDSRGMNQIVDELVARGYQIPTPDHSSQGDVRALRASWRALEVERASLLVARAA